MNEGSNQGNQESVRVDIWTWAVRLYKTRALSGAACRKDQVRVNDQSCRPSRQVRVGDRIEITKGPLTRIVEVKAILSKRVGAKRVEEFLIDHTSEEAIAEAKEQYRLASESTPQRERGGGRPTKKERRTLEELMLDSAEEQAAFEDFVKSFTRRQ